MQHLVPIVLFIPIVLLTLVSILSDFTALLLQSGGTLLFRRGIDFFRKPYTENKAKGKSSVGRRKKKTSSVKASNTGELSVETSVLALSAEESSAEASKKTDDLDDNLESEVFEIASNSIKGIIRKVSQIRDTISSYAMCFSYWRKTGLLAFHVTLLSLVYYFFSLI